MPRLMTCLLTVQMNFDRRIALGGLVGRWDDYLEWRNKKPHLAAGHELSVWATTI